MISKLLRKSKNSLPIHFELGHVAYSLHVVTHQNSSNVYSAGEVMLEKLCQRPYCHCNHSQHCHATSRHNATTINRYEKQLNYSEWSKRHIHFSFLFFLFFYRLIATMLSMAALFIDYLNTTIAHKSCLQHRFIIVTIILWWRASGGAVLPIRTKVHTVITHIF